MSAFKCPLCDAPIDEDFFRHTRLLHSLRTLDVPSGEFRNHYDLVAHLCMVAEGKASLSPSLAKYIVREPRDHRRQAARLSPWATKHLLNDQPLRTPPSNITYATRKRRK